MAGLDFDNVVVTVDGKTVSTIAGAVPVFAVDPTWDGIADKPQTFPPSAHNHDGVYLPLHGMADLAAAAYQTVLEAGTDLDTLKPEVATLYYTSDTSASILNKPESGSDGFNLLVIRTGSGQRVQICTMVTGKIYSRVFQSNAWSVWTPWEVSGQPVYDNAGYKNSVYRGADLGSEYTAAQQAAVAAGTFEGLYLGDYWTIGGVQWQIVGFDCFYNIGNSTALTTHHVVVMPATSNFPDSQNYTMNDTATTVGGYKATKMRSTYLPQCLTIAETAFGAGHILEHSEDISNAVTDGIVSGHEWVTTKIEIPSEVMLFGFCRFPVDHQIRSNTFQFPLFKIAPHTAIKRQVFWLRDVVSDTEFSKTAQSCVLTQAAANASSTRIRPYFLLS